MADATTSSESNVARYMAEFVGTFMLVFTVGCVLSEKSQWAAPAAALTCMIMTYAFGAVSGANFNPAVSLSMGLSKKLGWKVVGAYCFIQLFAGLCAGTVFSFMLDHSVEVKTGEGFNLYMAMAAEMIYTAMLCFVALNVSAAQASQPNQYFGLAIGAALASGSYAVGGITGGIFNPAATAGMLSSALGRGIFNGMAWMAAQFLGACVAAAMFRLVRPEEFGNHAGSLGTKVLAEFIGTFMLVLTVGLSLVGKSSATPIAAASCLTAMIYSLGDVSGAHFNPAVSLGILARGGNKIELMQYGVYTAAQFGAGVLAGDLAGLFHLSSDNAEGISLRPGDYGMKAALTAEVLFTFMLVLVVLAVATTQNVNNSFSGLAIGSCVAAGGLASASLSGGVFNPAVALGLMSDNFISEHDVPWINFLFWLVAEMVGALLAAGMFFMTWRSEYKAASEYSVMENSADLAEKVLLEQETVLPEQETA